MPSRLLESETAIIMLDPMFIDDFKRSPQVCDRTFGNLLSMACLPDWQTLGKCDIGKLIEPESENPYITIS